MTGQQVNNDNQQAQLDQATADQVQQIPHRVSGVRVWLRRFWQGIQICVVLGTLWGGIYLYSAWQAIGPFTHSMVTQTRDMNSALLLVGDKAFAVPRAYLWMKSDHRGGRKENGFNMHGILDFNQTPPRIQPLWVDINTRQGLIIYALRKNFSEGVNFLRNWNDDKDLTGRWPAYDRPGLVAYHSSSSDDMKYYDQEHHLISCSQPDSVPNPSCEAVIAYGSDQYYLTATFGLSYLDQHRQIFQMLHDFMQATEQPVPVNQGK